MIHYDIDIHCRECKTYLFSTFNPPTVTPICKECAESRASPLEYFIMKLIEESEK